MFGRRRSAPSAAPQSVPFLESMLDGPTVRLPPPPAPSRRRSVLPVLLGVLALGGAAFAATLGWRALDQAQTARALAANATALPSPVPSVEGPAGDGTVLVEPAGSSPSPPGPSASPGPPPGYTDRELIIPLGCAATMFLDVDDPRVSVSETPRPGPTPRRACQGASSVLRLGPGANAGATYVVSPAGPTPAPTPAGGSARGQGGGGRSAQACEQQIRSSPLDPGTTVPITLGTALCVRATTGRIVLLEVTAVDAEQATIRANSWR